MKNVTIYVDEGDWDMVKESAYQFRQSAGVYLMGLYKAQFECAAISAGPAAVHDTQPKEKIPRVSKKNSKDSVCSECRAPFGHRAGCGEGS